MAGGIGGGIGAAPQMGQMVPVGNTYLPYGSPQWQTAQQQFQETNAQPSINAAGIEGQKAGAFGSAALSPLMGTLNSALGSINGSGVGTSGGMTSGSGAPLQISGVGGSGSPSAVDTAADAADSAAFAKAKTQAGQTARSTTNSIENEMAGRGIAGSGTEGRNLVNTLTQATNSIGNETNAELGNRVGIAENERNLGSQQSIANLNAATTQRGQDVQAQTAANQIAAQKQTALLSMLASISPRVSLSANSNYAY